MVNRVKAEVTRRNLVLTPQLDGAAAPEAGDNAFAVTVTNASESFASFQIELSTPGVTAEAINEWYRVEPEICTKKPPGSKTTFQVIIIRSPIPVYETTIELLLRVFSIEYRNLFVTQKLYLTIHKPKQSLILSLPTQAFKGAPGDLVNIPVLLSNYSASTVETRLACIGLETWLEKDEQTVRVNPNYPAKVAFRCQIPPDPTLLSQEYAFSIQANPITRGPIPAVVKGTLEVLPLGMVEFICTPTHQQIPSHHLSEAGANYQIELQNASHLQQQINIIASEADQEKFELELPEPVVLAPGGVEICRVTVHRPRHWFGGKRQFQFDLVAEVYDPEALDYSHRTRAVPDRQTLSLTILPRISNWLLGLLGLLLTLGLLWWLLLLPKHRASVNSVRLDGNASTVFSGSSDQSILRWQVDHNPFRALAHRLRYEGPIARNLEKAVRVIRLKPADNNIIAAGLENGTIQLWDVLGNQPQQTLFSDNDRVFDLAFSPDSRYLFSGHGSGQVRQWNLDRQSHQPLLRLVPNPLSFSIAALTTYQPESGSSWIGFAGQFNQLVFWDWANHQIYQIQSIPPTATSAGQYQYIESLAIANQLLVTADNQGNIKIWNLARRHCEVAEDDQLQFLEVDAGYRKRLRTNLCRVPIVARWQHGRNSSPVRSIAITTNGLYLASVGDDGQVKLWQLETNSSPDPSPDLSPDQLSNQSPDQSSNQVDQQVSSQPNGQTLDRLNVPLYGVDIQASDRTLIVTAAAADHQVYVYRIQIPQDGFR